VWHLMEIREMCHKQRMKLVLERERVTLCRDLRHITARLQLGKVIRRETEKELEAIVRPLVESVTTG
jgi:hypothetical protein